MLFTLIHQIEMNGLKFLFELCDDSALHRAHFADSPMVMLRFELEALSRGLNLTITVIQSDGPELSFNKFTDNQSIKNDEKNHHQDGWKNIYLSYHRFAFSLGEHYNALLPLDNNPNHY